MSSAYTGINYWLDSIDLLQKPARSQISVVKREAQFEDDYGSGDFPDDEDYNYACEAL